MELSVVVDDAIYKGDVETWQEVLRNLERVLPDDAEAIHVEIRRHADYGRAHTVTDIKPFPAELNREKQAE